MSILLIAILTLALLGIVACLALRGPMIRAFEDRHGLTDSRKAVTDARKARNEAKVKAAQFESRRQALAGQILDVETEVKKLEQQLKAMPQAVYTLVFELGAGDMGLPPFEFIVSRLRRSEPGDSKGPERELWSRPRILRAYGRNAQTAMAAALARFPAADGFTVRPAERVDAPQHSKR
ncbi:MAG TPA: hypothetical protein VGV37_00980 [Aliidongia sp.]|uniref:hypothetical protein n=1 Tax=Aliidongia sp. TaxID=1914230 RepID=UPI002DDCBF6F|nr:hypothetical protein [Aliidongia sp.]HEV2673080.1 hypothetical protein [Aliidongia sp.]